MLGNEHRQRMSESVSSRDSDDHGAYMLQWLRADASNTGDDDGTPSRDSEEGFVARLYNHCLCALQYILKTERIKSPSSSRSSSLGECLGRLFLWGDAFDVGQLDRALDQSDEMKLNVLEQLARIGKLLLRGKRSRHILHAPSC